MSEEKKCKKSMKKSINKKESRCTCSENDRCSNSEDNSFDTGATIRDVPDAAFVTYDDAIKEDKPNLPYEELVKTLDMDDVTYLLKEYFNASGKNFDDIATAFSEEERHQNESLFLDMAEKVEDAIKTFMRNSTDSDEIKNKMIKEMFTKFTALYLSSTFKNKIDDWKKAQKHTCADIKDKINKGIEKDKKDEPKVVLKSLEDIFPWMKDESANNTEEDTDDGDSEYLKDFDFPFTYKDEKHNITINADIIGESNDSIDIQIETEYDDEDMNISQITEISYDRDEKFFKFFDDCFDSINDIYRMKNSYCN